MQDVPVLVDILILVLLYTYSFNLLHVHVVCFLTASYRYSRSKFSVPGHVHVASWTAFIVAIPEASTSTGYRYLYGELARCIGTRRHTKFTSTVPYSFNLLHVHVVCFLIC